MNAHGVSVFYGADDPKVALAEVRPPIGSKGPSHASLLSGRSRLLDLTALNRLAIPGSIFDPIFCDHLERAAFLKSLSDQMTKPVMPDDEALEYLATQAVADYLATETLIDGIIFPSVQAAGEARNVALFYKAALVDPLDLPPEIDVRVFAGANVWEGWEFDPTVWEGCGLKKTASQKEEEKL